MDHYYSSKPSSESNRDTIKTKLVGRDFSFITDSGVFSKNRVDVGSEVLMEAAAKADLPAGNILDVGCGYGPIGLYLASNFLDREIEMVDVNERALDLAKENAALNEITNVKIYESNLFEQIEGKNYAAIISNPPIRAGKKVVHQILEESYDHLTDGGILQIVIQKKQGAPSAKKKMEEVFGNVERVALDKGYWVLESKKN